ncbi:MAG: hypothetical protein LBU87_02750 [Lactobacillales bacterium]|jgi:hypothetical protein|nr:hypothetical protein [Lactobacillales bacterium]
MIADITRTFINNWLAKLKKAWIEKEFAQIEELFKKCAFYQESPYIEIARNAKEIKSFWNEIKIQKNPEIAFEILCVEKDTCIINFNFTCDIDGHKHSSNGIYYIEFDGDGYCTKFAQWSENWEQGF